MSSDVQNRQDIREAFGVLLIAAIEGSGKPAQKVFDFPVGDFGGRYSVVTLDSQPSTRGKQAQVTRVASNVKLDVHTFVLYAHPPVRATNNVIADDDQVIEVEDTSLFTVGEDVCVTDGTNYDLAKVTVIDTNVSITVESLDHAFTTPDVYWWNEKLAANRKDWLEKEISDVVMDNDTTTLWDQLSFDGTPTDDPVNIGGKPYLHEIIHLNFELKSE
jgi:hypothetical protein